MSDKKIDTKCLECRAQITLDSNTQIGEVITCPQCSADLEVTQVKPIKISLAPKVQEDWGQ